MFSLKQWVNDGSWSNWVGYVNANPELKLLPRSVKEVQHIVRRARLEGKRVRVTGAAHSFSGCACPEEIALSLHNMRGIISVDKDRREITLYAGTYLHEIGSKLHEHGLALENMGDIQSQTIAGAVSTATHGTGVSLGSIANQVVAWEWVDGTGEVRFHQRGDPEADELGNALHVSLGMLGIFTKLTIKVVPLYGLKENNEVTNFKDGLTNFRAMANKHRHMEWFLFPGTNRIQQKTLSVIEPKAMTGLQKLKDGIDSRFVTNGAYYLICEWARMYPTQLRRVSRMSAHSIPKTKREGYYYEVFPTPRNVKFNETEFFIDLQDFETCINEVNDCLHKDMRGSHFPIEVRTHKGETGMLSPTQGRDSAVLSFHVYQGMDCEPLFTWINEYMKKWQARPHWGKVNKLSHDELTQLYPKLERFMQIREKYDPDNVFMNKWLDEKFLDMV